MVQLKGNLIPTHVLQVENSRMKITSCIQYFNECPLHSYQHQANRPVCASANVTLILNKFLNETEYYYTKYMMKSDDLTNTVSVCSS